MDEIKASEKQAKEDVRSLASTLDKVIQMKTGDTDEVWEERIRDYHMQYARNMAGTLDIQT